MIRLPILAFAAPGYGGYGGPPGPGGPPPGGFGGPPPGGNFGFPVPPPMPVRQMHAMAIVSLVSAIVSWMMCPLIGGIVAVVTGMMAKKAIKNEPEKWDPTGGTMALIGMILGGINFGLWLLFVLFYVVMILFVGTAAVLGA